MRAGQVIEHQFTLLETEPEIGRPVDDLPELRELIIPFGDAGYVAFYHHEVKIDLVYGTSACAFQGSTTTLKPACITTTTSFMIPGQDDISPVIRLDLRAD